jgi:hypothetical protein
MQVQYLKNMTHVLEVRSVNGTWHRLFSVGLGDYNI